MNAKAVSILIADSTDAKALGDPITVPDGCEQMDVYSRAVGAWGTGPTAVVKIEYAPPQVQPTSVGANAPLSPKPAFAVHPDAANISADGVQRSLKVSPGEIVRARCTTTGTPAAGAPVTNAVITFSFLLTPRT